MIPHGPDFFRPCKWRIPSCELEFFAPRLFHLLRETAPDLSSPRSEPDRRPRQTGAESPPPPLPWPGWKLAFFVPGFSGSQQAKEHSHRLFPPGDFSLIADPILFSFHRPASSAARNIQVAPCRLPTAPPCCRRSRTKKSVPPYSPFFFTSFRPSWTMKPPAAPKVRSWKFFGGGEGSLLHQRQKGMVGAPLRIKETKDRLVPVPKESRRLKGFPSRLLQAKNL
jgi:hypothetical protein